jgi:antibiotic biosynthesis monooxygenase (ABM) superfamily enzyme
MRETPMTMHTPAGPTVHRRALITWLAIYPTITLVLGMLGPVTADLPLPLRTLILTVIVVPVGAYVLIPALMKANAAFDRRAHRGARRMGRQPEGDLPAGTPTQPFEAIQQC